MISGNEKEEENCECPHWPKLIDESHLDQWKWELEDKVTKCMKGRHRLSLQAYVRSWFDKDQYPSYDSLGQHSVPKQFMQCMSKLAVSARHMLESEDTTGGVLKRTLHDDFVNHRRRGLPDPTPGQLFFRLFEEILPTYGTHEIDIDFGRYMDSIDFGNSFETISHNWKTWKILQMIPGITLLLSSCE